MKIFLALTNIPEEIYLENYPFFFSHDQNWCDEYIQNHRVYFESQERENKEIFEIIHVFDDEKSLEDFLLHQFETVPKYSAILDTHGKKLIRNDVAGYRVYLPLIKAKVFLQVMDSVQNIKNPNDREHSRQLIMKVPDYSICELKGSKNPLVLIAISR